MIIWRSCGVCPRSISEPTDEADRGRHAGFARYEGLAGGPGSLSLSFGGTSRLHWKTWSGADSMTGNDEPLTPAGPQRPGRRIALVVLTLAGSYCLAANAA